jgi:hypothetical protein
LARPSSLWARRRYDADQLTRARKRYSPTGRVARLGTFIGDVVAGAPSDDAGTVASQPPGERE